MSSPTTISSEKLARLIGTAHTPALIDVRTDEDFAADPRLIPGAVRRSHQAAADWGEEFAGRSAIVVCLRGAKLAQGTAAWLQTAPTSKPSRSKAASKAGRRPTCPWCCIETAPAQRTGAHRLGDARAAEDRPHRLSLADPAVHRSERGVSVRGAVGGGRGRRALQRRPLRHRKHLLEPSRRTMHVRRDGRGVRAGDAADAAAGDHGARRRHRAARSLVRKRPACSRHRWACRGCMTTISNSSRPASCSTTRSIAGAAMRPARPTTGPPTRRSHDGRRCRRGEYELMPATASALARLSGLAAGGAVELRRPGRADRGHAPHPGRGKELDLREPFPARAQLLHAAAGPGGAAACDLYRLAVAPDRRRHHGRRPVHSARHHRHHGPELYLRGLSAMSASSRRCSSAEGRGAGDRDPGRGPRRQTRAAQPGHDRAGRRSPSSRSSFSACPFRSSSSAPA